jgi:hypothetical protein
MTKTINFKEGNCFDYYQNGFKTGIPHDITFSIEIVENASDSYALKSKGHATIFVDKEFVDELLTIVDLIQEIK